MMDLTPLDVRKKKGDFRRGIRGYEQAQVDDFLDLVADRMETLVRAASNVDERIKRLEQQVSDYRDREKALTEALVSAQQMREDIRSQSTREVELLRKQAEQEAERIRSDAVRMRDREEQALDGLRSRQFQFMASYRNYLEQELSELAAMVQALDMRKSGRQRATPGEERTASTPSTSQAESGAESRTGDASEDPAAESASVAADSPAVVVVAPRTPMARPAMPPTAATPATVTAEPHGDELTDHKSTEPEPTDGESTDEVEEALDEALARWEPELGAAGSSAGAAGPEPEEDADEFEAEDLVLSAEDVVGSETSPADAPDAGEDDVDLSFLEFGEEDIVEAGSEAASAVQAERVEREVRAAMVEAEDEFIDLGAALGDEPDETADAIDAAFDFGDDEGDAPQTRMHGPRSGTAAAPEAPEQKSGERALDSDIDFVDSLLMDAETLFDEDPEAGSAEPPSAAAPTSQSAGARPGDHDLFGDEFDGPDPDAGADDEFSAGEPERSDLIDLDAFRGFTSYEPPAPASGDVSSLTLHPMFFERESSDVDGADREESRQDRWSSSGGG